MAFSGLTALGDVDLHVRAGEILGLIGPNGAGKTTLVNIVSGFQRPTAGSVLLDGESIDPWPAHRRARHGIVRTFQAVRLFATATVVGNVIPAALGVGWSGGAARQQASAALARVGLEHRAHDIAADLPYGEERLVGIARALAAAPSFLLLDEPAAGLNESETARLRTVLRRVRDDLGCAIVLIEHDFRLITSTCDRVHVLNHGRTIAVGTPDEVRNDPAVLAAYLGREASAPATGDAP